jgi:taurine dioxygenase
MPLDLQPLTPVIGAEVRGIDLRESLADDTAEKLRAAWDKYQVLLFRDQAISVDDQRRFVNVFGEIQPPLTRLDERLNPDVMYVANVKVEGEKGDLPDGEMHFHADQCYVERPARGAILCAIEIPSKGGNTLFASTYRAYETLPDELRTSIAGRDAVFTFDAYNNPYKRAALDLSKVPHFVHPMVIAHPATGRPALFVNRLMTDSIVGMSRDESEPLLERLFTHLEQRENVYEHVWRPGDVLIWDNLSTLHARTDFDPKERRALRRTAIRGVPLQAYSGAQRATVSH